MSIDLRCYGDDIQAVAEMVPDFDLRSPMDVESWFGREWQAIADVNGFAQQLAAVPRAVPTTPDRVTAMTLAGLTAFEHALRAGRPGVPESQARVQSAVIQAMTATGLERGELWRVTADPTTLSTGACYAEGGRSLRAFYPDTAPGYFGDGWTGPPPRAESRCGWTTPLVLHLGTFPWVYSSRLDASGPGLRWSSATAAPAVDAFRIMASSFQPEANLRQDARQVAAIYRHFTAQTAPLISRLPTYRQGQAQIGRLYRRAGFLHVQQGSLHVAGINGPRGQLPATAYNHIVRRFAVFFAVRRATVRALTTWAPEMGRLVATSTDPCLRAQVEGVVRAG